MTELQVVLSIDAMKAMAHGQELVFDVQDEAGAIRLMLRCDDHALATIRDQVEKAMLHFLPVDGQRH